MPYRSRLIVMLKQVLITRNSSSIVPCPDPLGVAPGWAIDDIVRLDGNVRSGTVDIESDDDGPTAGVLPWVRAGVGLVSDRGILSVQWVYSELWPRC